MKHENQPPVGADQTPVKLSAKGNEHQWCFCYSPGASHGPYKDKAAMLNSVKWQRGEEISISFLDGEEELQERVMNVAMAWVAPGMANLKFIFRIDTNNTDIRISFKSEGSWSTLGTSCRNITDINKPTMNFGWLNMQSTDEEIRDVVLHEFGHAIGLIHEHLNPRGEIQWNKERVRRNLSGPPNYWDDETIDRNMWEIFTEGELKLTEMDKDSIMMYPIPRKWTTDGFSVGLNTQLSETDKEFIRKAYPGNNVRS
jgi:serralysin